MADFDVLWRNHPARQDPVVVEPCTGRTVYSNQSVIRLGSTFAASGVEMTSYHGLFCSNGHGRHHPLRVEQMKVWLNSERVTFVPYTEKSVRAKRGLQNTFRTYLGKCGIVAFLDFWGPGSNGDHIDLWNGNEIAHGDLDYFERSREIWFWRMT